MSNSSSKPRPIVSRPSVLLLHEKHGVGVFPANNDEDLFASALLVLTGRFRQGHWYHEPDKPRDLGYTREDLVKFPPGIQFDAANNLKNYAEEMEAYQREIEDYETIKQAVEKQDGRLAWAALKRRSDQRYEYERVSIQPLSTKYGD